MIPWYKKWWGILLILLLLMILALVFAFGLLFRDYYQQAKSQDISGAVALNQEIDPAKLKIIEGESRYSLGGAAKPKVTIVEFSDFNCPYSRQSFPIMRELGRKYAAHLKIIYRHYPVRDGSPDLAATAECAGEQGLFWLMHDKLFINQGAISSVGQLAAESGADMKKFSACVKNNKYLKNIQKDYQDAQALGVKGTPTFFINGYKAEGTIPLNMMEKIIQTIISK